MFQKVNKAESAASINLIGTDTIILGNITSNSDIRIDGTLKGNITTSGKLVLGLSGKIEGDVTCQNADVSGEIHGKVSVTELLSLKVSAKIMGDIVTCKLSIEPNASFTGTCNMGAIVKNISDGKQTEQETAKTA